MALTYHCLWRRFLPAEHHSILCLADDEGRKAFGVKNDFFFLPGAHMVSFTWAKKETVVFSKYKLIARRP
jgi:hypothetical protein